MPIRPQFRYLYPIDWPQLSAVIRFERAKGKCEACGRPHGQEVRHLGDGRWWNEQRGLWVNGRGRPLPRLIMRDGQPVKDYDDRRRRQAEGTAKAKASGRYKGRAEDRKRNDGIAAMLRSGSSWQQVQDAFRCSSSTVAWVKARLDAEAA